MMLRDHFQREMLVVISSLTVEYRGVEWGGVDCRGVGWSGAVIRGAGHARTGDGRRGGHDSARHSR